MSLSDDAKQAGKGWILKHVWPIIFGALVLVAVLTTIVLLRH